MRSLLARRSAAAEGPEGTPATGDAAGIALGVRIAAVVAVLGLAAVVVFGSLWWLADHGADAATAAARDDALVAARQIAVNLQSLDYNTVDEGLDTWQSSATGPLLQEFNKNRAQYADQLRKVQTTSTARVVDIALADFAAAAGKARAIGSVDVKTTQNVNGSPSLPVTRQVRIQLELVRMPDGGWKAAAASAIRSATS